MMQEFEKEDFTVRTNILETGNDWLIGSED
jgi:hypothetical protein